MSTTTAPAIAREPGRRSQLGPLLVGVGLSIGCTVAGCLLLAHVRPQLPDPVATHWGATGAANGFTSLNHVVASTAALCCAAPLVLLAIGTGLRQVARLVPVAVGTAALMTTEVVGSMWVQRGHSSASSRMDWRPLALGLLAGLLVGAVVWWATRRWRDTGVVPTSTIAATVLPVGPNARVAWTGQTRSGRVVRIVVPVALAVPLLTAAVTASVGGWGTLLGLVPAEVLLAVALTSTHCQVSIDARGLRALGMGVVPFARIPLDAVAGATAIDQVEPLADFGGWGLRGSMQPGGGWGIITAAGPALRVHRNGKKDFWITVDHPEQAAAALNTLVAASGREPVGLEPSARR